MRPALLALLLLSAPTFAAPISFVDVYRTQTFTQTTAAQPSVNGYYFATNVYMTSAGDFDGATFTPPGGSATAMTLNGLAFSFSSPSYSTLSAFNAAYPAGAYSFTATDSTASNPDAPQTVGVVYSDAFGTSTPYVTDFTALNGLDPTAAFNVTWNAFTGALGGGNDAFVFFQVFDHTSGTTVFDQAFLPSSQTSALIPGSTLLANHQYDFQLIFSNRQISAYSSGSADFAPVVGSDLRTGGSFTTGAAATPEPALFFTVGAGLLAVVARRRRLS